MSGVRPLVGMFSTSSVVITWPTLALEETIMGTSAVTSTLCVCCPMSSLISTTGCPPTLRIKPWRVYVLKPGKSAVISYSPGDRNGIEYSPLAEERVSDLVPV
jgi:hypothetical protein